MKQWSPHPKREPSIIFKPPGERDTQQSANSFTFSFSNLVNIMQDPCPSAQPSALDSDSRFPLAKYLFCVPFQPKPADRLSAAKVYGQRANKQTDTTVTQEDEESQYQNYLKEYETVVKNSRKKDYLSPVDQKEEMDELITEFLSGIKGKSSINNDPKLDFQTAEKRKARKQKVPHQDLDVRVEKIDLSQIQKKSQSKSRVDDGRQARDKKEKTPVKHINLEEYKKEELKSPRFALKESPKQTSRKSPKKQQQKLTVKVLKAENLRYQHKESPLSTAAETKQLRTAKTSNGYNNTKTQGEKDSYLKKNIHKTMKNKKQGPSQTESNVNCQQAHYLSNIEAESHCKKPIKIEIQIPLEQQQMIGDLQRVQEYDVESPLELQQEETQIIRQISQKVLSLIQKTKDLTPQKNGGKGGR